MLNDLRIEALANGCAQCSTPFKTTHRVLAGYHVSAIRSFAHQVELGIIGAGARNLWVHIDCGDPALAKGKWFMNPDIHHCIRCGSKLSAKEIVNPVFQVVDPDMVNPTDPTDRGVSLGDRIYFMHADCKNTGLDKQGGSILITP